MEKSTRGGRDVNLLVTGGAGFIGSNFIRAALTGLDAGGNIVNLDKLTYAGNPANLGEYSQDPRYHFVEGDIADRPLVAKLLRENSIGAIVHFAAESHVDRSIEAPALFLETNIFGTFALLEEARSYWKEETAEARDSFRFLHVSTDEVYGSLAVDDPAFSEKTAYAPNSPYSASKAASDHLVRAYFHTYGLPVLTTNCSNNYGPYQFPEKLIPLMILNALDGKPLPVYGDGKNVRDWLFVGDHCSAIRAVLRGGRCGEVYNVGGESERTNLEVVHALCRALEKVHPRGSAKYADLISFVADRPGHDRRYAIDSRKIQKELGWRPLESFDSGLEKTVEWYVKNRSWCEAIHQRKYQRQRLGL